MSLSYYPAVVVAVDSNATTVEIESTGKKIVLPHSAHNAVATEARQNGTKGFISFPKAPPVFTLSAQPAEVEQSAKAA